MAGVVSNLCLRLCASAGSSDALESNADDE